MQIEAYISCGFFQRKKSLTFERIHHANKTVDWVGYIDVCTCYLYLWTPSTAQKHKLYVTPLSQQPEASFFCIKGNPSYERDFNVPIVISSHATLDGPGTLPNIVRCIVNLTSLWLLPGDILQSPTCRIHKIYIHLCIHTYIFTWLLKWDLLKVKMATFWHLWVFFTYREKSVI